jgi:metallo-beta-lactamase class B
MRILTAIGVSVVTVALAYARPPTAAQEPAGAPSGRGGGRAGRGSNPKLPTEAQWAAMSPKAREYVDRARTLAGNDPDLQFDLGIFCKATGGSQNEDRATIGVPDGEPHLQPFPAPDPPVVIGAQRLFDNFYWIGNTGIGAWLITSDDGYILFDTMNSEADARDILIPAMKKLNLDPTKIKYLVFGHHHFDHTGGGAYIQRLTGAKAVMHRDDWDIYFRSTGRGGRGNRGGTPDETPARRMERDIDATDGMKITVGDVTGTIFTMTGHTPGSIGMVVPVKYQGRQHPILLVTAGTDVNTRGDFIGGYEHIWDEAIKMRVENVMQSHPNTNMNLLARVKYVNDSYPPAKNPLLYGAARTERYINIMRDCTLARLEILGW